MPGGAHPNAGTTETVSQRKPAGLVVFGEDWGAHPSSTQHLARRLLRDRQVLWVNSIGLRRPRLTVRDIGRLAAKARRMLTPAETRPAPSSAPTPHILDPWAAPFPGNPLARRLNRRWLSRAVRAAMARSGMERPILWASLPTAVDVIGTLNERAAVYYCGDDFAALEGVDHEPVVALEAELVEKADLILAASPVLARRFPARKTRVLPHGVDVDLFAAPAPRPPDLPAGGPVAGFYGSVSDWVDLTLLAQAAQRMPQWRFVFVGPVKANVKALKKKENVIFLGPRPHEALPSYAQNWDASLLPFRDTAQIRACNPLKLREYLAAGRPVVSTDFPALDGYRGLVTVVGSAEELCAALEAARHERAHGGAKRRAAVKRESWTARAADVSQLLARL